MNGLRWVIAVATVAFITPAQAATTDPEVILYRVSGVSDSGGNANTGVATSFHCTNFSGVTETVRIVLRAKTATLLTNVAFTVQHLETHTTSTKATNLFSDDTVLNSGLVFQGTAAIAATSTNIICTSMIVDAAATAPAGISLRMLRFNPIPGTQE